MSDHGYFYYTRDLKGKLWPTRSLEKPNALASEQFTKVVEERANVRFDVPSAVIALTDADAGLDLVDLSIKYPANV